MTKLTTEQQLFIDYMKQGHELKKVTDMLGRARSTPWNWARTSADFAAQFAVVYPPFGQRPDRKVKAKAKPKSKAEQAVAPTVTLHQLAMQRLDREIRTDGPNAVIAAAAVLLIGATTCAAVVEPDAAPEVVAAPDDFALESPSAPTGQDELAAMFAEVFPTDNPATFAADTSIMRHFLDEWYGCSIAEKLNLSSRMIASYLAKIVAAAYPVAYTRGGGNHAKVYLIPQPKVRG
jgi:hypothetical protein